jgi:hypothetical protein
MTKKEKILIQKAIDLIHMDDNYEEGMDILKRLIDPKWISPIDNLRNIDLKTINSREIALNKR